MLQLQKLRPRKVRWFASHQLRPKVRTKTQSFLLIRRLSNLEVLRNYLEILSAWWFLPLHFDSAGLRCSCIFNKFRRQEHKWIQRPHFEKFCSRSSVLWQMLFNLWSYSANQSRSESPLESCTIPPGNVPRLANIAPRYTFLLIGGPGSSNIVLTRVLARTEESQTSP